jgi:hypothetical protein
MRGKVMHRVSWRSILVWVIAGFFAFDGVGNIFASDAILDDYHRWGYPAWFHFITGMLELTTAILLLRSPRRLIGAGIGIAVMASAAATVIGHGEYSHAIAPLFELMLVTIVALTTFEGRRAEGSSQS